MKCPAKRFNENSPLDFCFPGIQIVLQVPMGIDENRIRILGTKKLKKFLIILNLQTIFLRYE